MNIMAYSEQFGGHSPNCSRWNTKGQNMNGFDRLIILIKKSYAFEIPAAEYFIKIQKKLSIEENHVLAMALIDNCICYCRYGKTIDRRSNKIIFDFVPTEYIIARRKGKLTWNYVING